MEDTQLFLVLVLGLAVGSFLGNRLAKSDPFALIGWTMIGAMPGAAMLVGKPKLMLAIIPVVPLMIWRWRHVRRENLSS